MWVCDRGRHSEIHCAVYWHLKQNFLRRNPCIWGVHEPDQFYHLAWNEKPTKFYNLLVQHSEVKPEKSWRLFQQSWHQTQRAKCSSRGTERLNQYLNNVFEPPSIPRWRHPWTFSTKSWQVYEERRADQHLDNCARSNKDTIIFCWEQKHIAFGRIYKLLW